MLKADMYSDQVDLCHYWPLNAPISCKDFLEQLKAGEIHIEDCSFLSPWEIRAFKLVLEAERYLPPVPTIAFPQPIRSGLFPINKPDKHSLVIVSGNNQYTVEVLTAVWAQGITPAYFLLVECWGNTVDMAMVYEVFTPQELSQTLKESGLEEKVEHRHMIVPGLTSSLRQDFARATGWEVEVGPICAVELPLFLKDRWIFSNLP